MFYDRHLLLGMLGTVCGMALAMTVDDPSASAHFSSGTPSTASAQLAIAKAPVAKPKRGKTQLTRAADGMFYLDAQINGSPVRFLIDTGSSSVVLSTADAARLKLDDASGASVEMRTASGTIPIRWATASHMQVAGKELHDVQVVVPASGPQVSLLGADVLRQLGPMLIDGDRIVLGPNPG